MDPLTVIGALTLAIFSLKVVVSVYKLFLRPAKNLQKLGKWAVITGATDGIGLAYAQQLAKKGLNIVLISRTEAKLQNVAKEIGGYGIETKYVVCDFSNFDKKARDNVSSSLKGLDIGILVNNVGVTNLIEMNINSTTWMTRILINGMVERKRGAIVNIASAAGLNTSPLLSQYSAAKSYIEKFSRGLSVEYAKSNVSVQCHAPFWVATKLAKMRESFSVPSPETYVRLSMKWIGYPDSVVSPIWFHSLMGFVLDTLPANFVNSKVLAMHLGIRKRGLKKEAKKKEDASGKSQ